jgi:hypothetical protein
MDDCQYRGYRIETRREWSNWCVTVYPLQPDLPILPRSTLHTLTPHEDDAVKEAKQHIDRILRASGNVAIHPAGRRDLATRRR